MSGEKPHGVVHTMVHRAPWWVPWLFLFTLFLGWATYQFVYVSAVAETNHEARQLIREANVEFCERENDLRMQVNEQAEIIRIVLGVAAESAIDRDSTEAAREYMDQANNIEEMDIVNCEELFPEEMQQARHEDQDGDGQQVSSGLTMIPDIR